jgi:WD40 repeat protein/serine/threonine protein kinase
MAFDYVGQHIGNYRLLRVLGQGAFALVYLGEHRYLKSAAALKVLRISLSEHEVQRFLQEAQLLVRLRHPHIVRVLDFAIEQDTPVIVMDYLAGGTARQRHPAGTRLSITMTTNYITQLASALQYAHNQRLIHRDVKPDNILFDAEQRLLLSDFGLAMLAPSIDQFSTQSLAGTPAYLAPEQIRGKPVFASDQYALGVLAYEWLTGGRPFQGRTWELMQQHLMEMPPPLREHCPDIPVAVEQVVLRSLAKDPVERYVSISAFAQALLRASRASGQDEDESQITTPVRAISRVATIAEVLPSSQVHSSSVVFLSVPSGDEHLVARLAADLSQRGIAIFRDAQGPGIEQAGGPREAMRTVQCVIVVGTRKTRSSRLVKEHLRLAQMYQRRVILLWSQGEEIASLLLEPIWQPFLPVDVVDARGARYQTAIDELLACLREGMPISTAVSTTLSTEVLREPRNPYKGLLTFHQEDTSDFFGRDALIQEASRHISSMLETEQRGGPATRLLTCIGASGSGKSSMVQAGLLPYLQAGAVPGSEGWLYLEYFVPGTHPIEALALIMAAHFTRRSVRAIYEDLQDDSARGLHRLAAQLVKKPHNRAVLVVDQFEELFTQTMSEEERYGFLELLLTAATEVDGPVIIVLTLRADFYDRLMSYPSLYRLTQKHLISVLPMDIHELRAIIEEPAALPDVQLTFEGALVGDLLFEAQGQVGALPLLEFTLDQLFQYRRGRQLTLQAYQAIGGVSGALARHAEATYASLPSEEDRRLARALFVRLIDPGVTEQDTTRRRARFSEFALADPLQRRRLQEAANVFIAARLLTTNEVAGITILEVSHEALIREWARLAAWVREAREDIFLQQSISEDASVWQRHGYAADRLYRGSQLMEALRWKEANLPSLDEEHFLQASIEEFQRTQQEERRQRQRYTRRMVVLGLTGVIGMAGTGFLVYTFGGNDTRPSRNLPPKSLPYTYSGHNDAVKSVAWSPDGKHVASGSDDHTVQVWDARSGALLFTYTGHSSSIVSVAWSPDSKRIASGSWDKTAQVWDASNGRHQLTYPGHSNDVESVAWSPDGKHIASASRDSTVQVWDSSNGQHQLTYSGHTSIVENATWSPDGKRIASSSADQTVQVWESGSGQHQLTYSGHTASVWGAVWSPDGQRIASGSADQTVQVWDVSNGRHLLTYAGHTGTVESVAWSPNGKCIASSSNDRTVQVWQATTGVLLLIYSNHTDDVASVAWSPDSKHIVSASWDKTVQMWNASNDRTLLTYIGHSKSVWSVEWSPDGKNIASSSDDRTVQVWEASNGNRLLTYNGHSDNVASAAWSPDGKRIASSSADQTVQVWDAKSGLRQLIYKGHRDGVWSTAWSPDGTRIVSCSDDKTAQVWDANNGDHLLTYSGQAQALECVVWSADGTRIASSSDDHTVHIWDARTGQHLLTYSGHSTSVLSLAWSPNGTALASGSKESAQVWNANTGQHLLTYKGHDDFVNSVAWSPDSKRVASGSGDKTVQVWDVSSGLRLLTYTGHTNSVVGVVWSPDGTRIASSSVDKTAQVWDARH